MPGPGDRYLQVLLEARNRGRVIGAATLRRLRQGMAELVERTVAQEAVGGLTAARAKAIREQAERLFTQLDNLVTGTVNGGINATVDDIAALHHQVVDEITGNSKAIRGFDKINERVVTGLATQRRAATFMTTLRRKLTVDAIASMDALITAGVAGGVSAVDLTNDMIRVLSQNDPGLQEALAKLPRSGVAISRTVDVDYSKYGIPESQVAALRTVISDARRIAVSEINNTLREANAQALMSSNAVAAAQWTVSGIHDGLPSSPDECDYLATADLYDFGPGMYPPEAWPFAPHPYCGCYQGGRLEVRAVEDWLKPRPVVDPARAFDRGAVTNLGFTESRLDRLRTSTDRALFSQTRLLPQDQ
jgi:hypothetical protein